MRPAAAAALALFAVAGLNLYVFVSDTGRIRQLQLVQQGLQEQQQQLESALVQLGRTQQALQTEQLKTAKVAEVASVGGASLEGSIAGSVQAPAPELSRRVCGSPAVDGYSHVDPACLESSPTALWWKTWLERSRGDMQQLQVHFEYEADYDGLAVGWGINNKKASAQECAEACRNHQPGPHVGGPFQNLPCNAFVWCPTQHDVCFEPDAHKHTGGDCWLKFTEAPAQPEVNYRGKISEAFKKRHPLAPERVQWVTGVLLPPGTSLGNGTYGPRFYW